MRLKMRILEHDRPVMLSVCGMELTIDGMEKEEVLTIVADERGVIVETEHLQMEQESTISESALDTIPVVTSPCESVAILPEKVQSSIFDDELFRQLSALRKQLANEQRVPPYVIFNDKSLKEMVEKLPEDLTSFSSISGVGKSKLEKYGSIFLDTIRTYKGKLAS